MIEYFHGSDNQKQKTLSCTQRTNVEHFQNIQGKNEVKKMIKKLMDIGNRQQRFCFNKVNKKNKDMALTGSGKKNIQN